MYIKKLDYRYHETILWLTENRKTNNIADSYYLKDNSGDYFVILYINGIYEIYKQYIEDNYLKYHRTFAFEKEGKLIYYEDDEKSLAYDDESIEIENKKYMSFEKMEIKENTLNYEYTISELFTSSSQYYYDDLKNINLSAPLTITLFSENTKAYNFELGGKNSEEGIYLFHNVLEISKSFLDVLKNTNLKKTEDGNLISNICYEKTLYSQQVLSEYFGYHQMLEYMIDLFVRNNEQIQLAQKIITTIKNYKSPVRKRFR